MAPTSELHSRGNLHRLLAVAAVAQILPLSLFAKHALESGAGNLLAVSVVSIVLALLGAWAAWKCCAWAGWPVLTSASWTGTVGFFGATADHSPAWWSVVLLATLVLVLGVLAPAPRLARITWPIRIFCASVVLLTRYVAFWGLLFPGGLGIELPGFAKGFNDAMPFVPVIPLLHARFIGALYLGATVICVWHVFARSWAVARLLQMLIFLWTFCLLIVTLLHLDAFDWERSSTWLWFVAYLAFPTISIWIWRRVDLEPDADPTALPAWGRAVLHAQGVGLLLLSLLGLLAVQVLTRIWPWSLPDLLAQIYSAPFAAFGIGSCLAASCRGTRRRAVVPFCAATFAMAAGSLVASLIHRDKFAPGSTSSSVWFAGLGLVAVASLALIGFLFVRFRADSERPRSGHVHP